MSDWIGGEFGVSVGTSSELVEPPKSLLIVTACLAGISLLALLFNGWIGYVVAVAASIAGSVIVFQDLQRRSSPNYVTLNWFSGAVRALRLGIVAIALVHIIRLAIESAR